MSRPIRIVITVMSFALLGSILLNLFIFYQARNIYRRLLETRLNPVPMVLPSIDVPTSSPESATRRVVFLGDSRIAEWSEFPGIDGVVSFNLGRGGDTTAMALLRLDPEVLAYNPDVVVLQIGINDLKAIGVLPGRATEIVDAARRNIDELIDRLRRRGVKVVVLTIFPPGRFRFPQRLVWSDAISDAVAEVNEFLRGRAGRGVTVIDCDPLLSVDGRLDARFERDALHLNPAGYAALSDHVRAALSSAAFRSADAE